MLLLLNFGMSAISICLFCFSSNYYCYSVSLTVHVAGFVAGSLVELYGCRKIVISGTVIGALGFILSAFMPHIGFMFITFGILSGKSLTWYTIQCWQVSESFRWHSARLRYLQHSCTEPSHIVA